MAYCIMRIEKYKAADIVGLQREACRQSCHYNNSVDETRSNKNIALVNNDDWLKNMRQKINSVGAKERSNSVIGIGGIYTASPEWFENTSLEEKMMYFKECLNFHESNYGVVISAIIHMDESTPHMHIMSVPITNDGRLSARDLIGNRNNMIELQTKFHEQVGRSFGLERGKCSDSIERKQHITAQEYVLQKNTELMNQQHETIQIMAQSQAEACRNAVQISNDIMDEKEKLSNLRRQRRQLEKERRVLDEQIKRQLEKLNSIEQQIKRAVKCKAELRKEENEAIKQANKALADADIARKELDCITDRLKRADYTASLEREVDRLKEELENLQPNYGWDWEEDR